MPLTNKELSALPERQDYELKILETGRTARIEKPIKFIGYKPKPDDVFAFTEQPGGIMNIETLRENYTAPGMGKQAGSRWNMTKAQQEFMEMPYRAEMIYDTHTEIVGGIINIPQGNWLYRPQAALKPPMFGVVYEDKEPEPSILTKILRLLRF